MNELTPEVVALGITYYVVLLFSVSFHESAHAWAALRMGDDTAQRQGRISLNPLVHMDPIGTVPSQVSSRLALAAEVAGADVPLRLHLHDTRHTGVANAVAAHAAGVRTLDASIGGTGGCPFAPNATGNVATEDLVYLFDRMGVSTGLDLATTTATTAWLEERLAKRLPGALLRAGGFPAPAR